MYKFRKDYSEAKQNIVLDLDKALLYSFDMPDKDSFLCMYSKGIDNGVVNTFHVVNEWFRITHFRPHLKEFLDYCQFRFDKKAVWSAGAKVNVDMLSRALMDMSCIHFDLVLDREDTVFTKEQPFGDKKLQDVYDRLPGCSSLNTFIVDDNVTNFLSNPPNGVVIPPFVPLDPSKLTVDIDLMVLMEWFDSKTVLTSKDVRCINKSEIFNSFKKHSSALNRFSIN